MDFGASFGAKELLIMVGAIAIWLAPIVACALIAPGRGRSVPVWVVAALFFHVLALFALVLLPQRDPITT